MKKFTLLRSFGLIAGACLTLAACGDPYDPGTRALNGGLIGGGAGAAIGAIAGGPAIGAVTGAALGAGTGALTTPNRP